MCFHHRCAAGCTTACLKSAWVPMQHGCIDFVVLQWRKKIDLFYYLFICEHWTNAEDSFSFSLGLLLAVRGRGWDGVSLSYPGAESARSGPSNACLDSCSSTMEIKGYTVTGALWEYITNQDFQKCLWILTSQTSGIYPEETWGNLRKPAGKAAPKQLILQAQCCQCVCSSRSLFKILCLLGFSKYSPFVPVVIHTLFVSPLCDSVRVTSLFYFS